MSPRMGLAFLPSVLVLSSVASDMRQCTADAQLFAFVTIIIISGYSWTLSECVQSQRSMQELIGKAFMRQRGHHQMYDLGVH